MDREDIKAMCKSCFLTVVLMLSMFATLFCVGSVTNNLYAALLSALLVFIIGTFLIIYFFPKVFEEYISYHDKKVGNHNEEEKQNQ